MAKAPGTGEQVNKDTKATVAQPLFGTGDVTRKATVATAAGIKYERSAYMAGAPGLPETTNNNKNRTEKVTSNSVEFSPQLVEGIKLPIMTHFQRIVELQNQEITDPTTGKTVKAYDRIREESMQRGDPTIMLEQSMLALITTDGQVDKEKIDRLAGDPRFMEASMRILMRRKRDIFQAVGVREIINPRGNRANLLNTGRTITLGVDQGTTNDAARRFAQWWAEPLLVAGRDTNLTHGQVTGLASLGVVTGAPVAAGVGIAGGALVGGGLGLLLGGGVGMVPGALLGAKIGAGVAEGAAALGTAVAINASRSGLRVNFERRADLLQSARDGSSIRDEYLYGIDPKDFQITANGRGIGIDPARNAPGQRIHTTNLEGSFQEAIQTVALQQMYAEALQIDPKKFESETQYLHQPRGDWRTGSAPQTGEKMTTDIHREFATILARAEEEARNQGAFFNENFEVRSRLFNQAEATVIQRRLEAIMKEPVRKQETRRSENLDKKAASFTKGTPEFDARNKVLNEERARAEQDRAAIRETNKSLTDYQAEFSSTSTKDQELQTLVKSIKVVPSGGTPAIPASAADAIRVITSILEDPTATDKIQGVVNSEGITVGEISSIAKDVQDAETTLQTELAAADALPLTKNADGKDVKSATAIARTTAAQAKYDRKTQELTEKTNLLKALRKSITDKQVEVDQATENIKNNEKTKKGTETLKQLSKDYTTLVRDIGINPDNLRAGDIDVITREINRQARAGNTNAWDESQNSLEERRAVILNAIAEQRAQDRLNTTPNAAVLQPQFQDALFVGISEHELRYMSPAELLATYATRGPGAVTAESDIVTRRQAEALAANGRLTAATGARATARTGLRTARVAYHAVRGLAVNDPARVAAQEALDRASQALQQAQEQEAEANRQALQAAARVAAARTKLAEVTRAADRLRAIPPLAEADLEQAQKWSMEILTQHVEALKEYGEAIENGPGGIQALDLRIKAAESSLAPMKEQIARTKEIVTQWENGGLQSRVTSMMFDADTRKSLIDTINTGAPTSADPLSQAQGYTEEEITSSLTRGELTLLNMLTGYQEAGAERAKRFKEAQTLLANPGNFQALIEAVSTFTPRPIAAQPANYSTAMPAVAGFAWSTPTDSKNLLEKIAPLIQDRNFNANDMYRIIGLFTTKMYQRSMAL